MSGVNNAVVSSCNSSHLLRSVGWLVAGMACLLQQHILFLFKEVKRRINVLFEELYCTPRLIENFQEMLYIEVYKVVVVTQFTCCSCHFFH